jgi:hypothetical protein
MSESIEQDLRYPIGRLNFESEINADMISSYIQDLEEAPANLRNAVEGLSEAQLDSPYRPGGWTIRQVVHHLPDSHLNSYVRFKLALTEDNPVIKTYDEKKWADLADTFNTDIFVSVELLTNLHSRWVNLLKSLCRDDFKKTFRHPELGLISLEKTLAIYAWHSKHHIAHIVSLRKRMGW